MRGVVVSSVSSNEMSLADLERTIMTVESVAVPPWVHSPTPLTAGGRHRRRRGSSGGGRGWTG